MRSSTLRIGFLSVTVGACLIFLFQNCSGPGKPVTGAAASKRSSPPPGPPPPPPPPAVNNQWLMMTTSGAPTARSNAMMVSTGSKAIIFGGYTMNGVYYNFVNSGAVYDPNTNIWAPTSTTNAPSPRAHGSAVWTGSKMIVFGGYSLVSGAYSYSQTGGVYDPETDTWSPISTVNAPAGRAWHTAVWTGSKMVVFGGLTYAPGSATPSYFNDGGVYDLATNTWSPISLAGGPNARYIHSAVWTGNKMIVFGGRAKVAGVDTYFADGYSYDPATDMWTPINLTGAPEMRGDHRVVWTGSQMIVLYGQASSGIGARYNPVTDSWAALSATNAPGYRVLYTAVWTGSKVVMFGGYTWDAVAQAYVYTNTGGVYDPANNSWDALSTTSAPSARARHAAVWVGSKMVVYGGDAAVTGAPNEFADGGVFN